MWRQGMAGLQNWWICFKVQENTPPKIKLNLDLKNQTCGPLFWIIFDKWQDSKQQLSLCVAMLILYKGPDLKLLKLLNKKGAKISIGFFKNQPPKLKGPWVRIDFEMSENCLKLHHLRVWHFVCVCCLTNFQVRCLKLFGDAKKKQPIQAPKIAPQTWGHQGGIPGPHDFHPSLDSTKRPPWYNSPTSIRQIHQGSGIFRWKLDFSEWYPPGI